MSAFNPELISPLVLALAKVTAFLCIFIAAAMLLKKSSIKSILLSIALIMVPVVFVCSYTQPLLDIIPNNKKPSSQKDIANISTLLAENLPVINEHEAASSEINDSNNFIESSANMSLATSMDHSAEMTGLTEQAVTTKGGVLSGILVIFLLGCTIFILPLLWSFMRLAFVKKQSASGSPLEVWNKIWGASRAKPPLYFVPSPTAPCAYGVVKPCVILPKESVSWSQQKLKSTLYHEAEHLKRFDPFTRMIASVVRAVFWFHPLVWVAHRQLIQAQEECCDEAAILSGVHPEDYADELLVAAYGGSVVPKEALAMAKFSEIGRRVEKIIHFKPSQPLSSKKKVMFVVSPILCGLALATTGFAQLAEPDKAKKNVKLHRGSILSSEGEIIAHSEGGSRNYLYGEEMAHITGYVGIRKNKNGSKDIEGRAGIEKRLDNVLNLGKDVHLTIDAQIQQQAYQILEKKGLEGAIVVQDPTTGKIIALVSYPSYDANLFMPRISKESYMHLRDTPLDPLSNKALGDVKAGFAIAPITALSAEFKGIRNPLIHCKSELKVGKVTLKDWNRKRNENLDISSAMQTSCGVYFMQLALKTGLPAMQKISTEMGFTERIDPTMGMTITYGTTWRQTENKAIIALYGVGVGISASPLQLNRFTSAIATGVLNNPTILTDEPTTAKNLLGMGKINEQSLKTIRAGMIQSFSSDKEDQAEVKALKIAGLSGTAQQDPKSNGLLFTGYAPHDKPKYSVTVFLKEKKEKNLSAKKEAGGVAVEMFKVLLPR